ncbi:MAG: hypothetical protein AAF604_17840 [Acidobacteriota bacterium]
MSGDHEAAVIENPVAQQMVDLTEALVKALELENRLLQAQESGLVTLFEQLASLFGSLDAADDGARREALPSLSADAVEDTDGKPQDAPPAGAQQLVATSKSSLNPAADPAETLEWLTRVTAELLAGSMTATLVTRNRLDSLALELLVSAEALLDQYLAAATSAAIERQLEAG